MNCHALTTTIDGQQYVCHLPGAHAGPHKAYGPGFLVQWPIAGTPPCEPVPGQAIKLLQRLAAMREARLRAIGMRDAAAARGNQAFGRDENIVDIAMFERRHADGLIVDLDQEIATCLARPHDLLEGKGELRPLVPEPSQYALTPASAWCRATLELCAGGRRSCQRRVGHAGPHESMPYVWGQ